MEQPGAHGECSERRKKRNRKKKRKSGNNKNKQPAQQLKLPFNVCRMFSPPGAAKAQSSSSDKTLDSNQGRQLFGTPQPSDNKNEAQVQQEQLSTAAGHQDLSSGNEEQSKDKAELV